MEDLLLGQLGREGGAVEGAEGQGQGAGGQEQGGGVEGGEVCERAGGAGEQAQQLASLVLGRAIFCAAQKKRKFNVTDPALHVTKFAQDVTDPAGSDILIP